MTWTSPVLWFAVIVLVLFAVLFGFVFHRVAADDKAWSRYTYLYGSVEAIAFAAAGAIFGSTVQRQQTDRAQSQADKAEGKAADNATAATNGKALATAVKAEADQHASIVGSMAAERFVAPSSPAEGAAAVSHRLRNLADALFPE